MAEVTFFSSGSSADIEASYPELIQFSASNIANLIASLQFETTLEKDLLDQYMKMLLSIHPEAPFDIHTSASILESCVVLVEK